MPMNNAERAQFVKQLNPAPPATNASSCRSALKSFPKMVRTIRGALRQFDTKFQRVVAGADTAAKQTTFFDCISAETDGDLILHDIATLLDCLLPLANDYRQPDEDVLVTPFTDADVTAYLS